MRYRPTRLVAVALVVAAVLAGACAVPTDQSVQVIQQDRLDESLQNITTTTSTTLPAETRTVAYYLLAQPEGSEQRLVRQVELDVPFSRDLNELIPAMFRDGFKDSIEGGEELINRAGEEFDFVRIDLPPNSTTATIFLERESEELDDQTLRDAAAQLVWTLTGFETVGQILININGNPVPLLSSGTSDPVDTEDYPEYNPELLDEEPPETETSTTTTTTVPPTTEPASDADGG